MWPACESYLELVSLHWKPPGVFVKEGRGKKKKGFAKAGWQSRTSYLSPSSDLSMFSCLSKKDKRYDCSGMKTWVTFKQRKAETAVSGYEGNVNQP